MKLFLETNVLLDVLARREPWVDDAAALLSLIEEGGAAGFVAPHSIATIHYLLVKWLDRPRATQALTDLTRIVRVDQSTTIRLYGLSRSVGPISKMHSR